MSFEEELFKKYVPDFDALKRFGFQFAEPGMWLYAADIRFGQFRAEVQVSGQGKVSICLYDNDGVEYALIHVESATGEFVTAVRESCEQLLLKIRDACFREKRYLAEQTGRIVAAVKSLYQETGDDPWNDLYPGYGVFRNTKNRKWYALLMNVDSSKVGRPNGAVEILNVKAAPEQIQRLLTQDGFYSWSL